MADLTIKQLQEMYARDRVTCMELKVFFEERMKQKEAFGVLAMFVAGMLVGNGQRPEAFMRVLEPIYDVVKTGKKRRDQ